VETGALAVARPQKYAPRPIEVVYGDTPSAGANFSLTSPGRLGWRLLAVTFRLVTDANVADRAVTVDYDDGNGKLFSRNGFGAVVQASTTEDFAFQANMGQAAWNTAGQAFCPLLPVEFQGGQKVQINVANIQVTDALSRIVLAFERQTYAAS
jgi:hypothetical protein